MNKESNLHMTLTSNVKHQKEVKICQKIAHTALVTQKKYGDKYFNISH
jgi:hypothetical protein